MIDPPVFNVHLDDGSAFAISDLSCCYCCCLLIFMLSFSSFAVCMMIVVYADALIDLSVPIDDVVVVDVVVLFDPFLPDAVVDKDVDVEADADVLQEAVLRRCSLQT